MDRLAVLSRLLRAIQKKGRAAGALVVLGLVVIKLAPVAGAVSADKSALEKIQQRGVLKVAFYKDFPPFSHNGRGIDVDLAQALAVKLGVKMSPLWFDAAEKLEIDLRWMVSMGHPLGFGPADVLMRVPVDSNFMARVKQVEIFAPYQRERYAIGRQVEKLPTLESLEPFEKLSLAVEDGTMAQQVMLSADNGRYRAQLKIFKNAGEAIDALKSGAVVAALAQQGELEGNLQGDTHFVIELPPQQVLKMRQWVVGLAVKAENLDLAKALQQAMNELTEDGTVKSIMQRHGVTYRKP